jgi:hypothetical protein
MPDNSTIDASIELYEKEIERVLGWFYEKK